MKFLVLFVPQPCAKASEAAGVRARIPTETQLAVSSPPFLNGVRTFLVVCPPGGIRSSTLTLPCTEEKET